LCCSSRFDAAAPDLDLDLWLLQLRRQYDQEQAKYAATANVYAQKRENIFIFSIVMIFIRASEMCFDGMFQALLSTLQSHSRHTFVALHLLHGEPLVLNYKLKVVNMH
jgi:hypothetical protein